MDGIRSCLVHAMFLPAVLAIVGCKAQSVSPIDTLRNGLNSYLTPGSNEPIDDKDNMARMARAVEEIRRERLTDGIPILLDVALTYDATDNTVRGSAEDVLVEFSPLSLQEIESRIVEYTKDAHPSRDRVPSLEYLRRRIIEKQGT